MTKTNDKKMTKQMSNKMTIMTKMTKKRQTLTNKCKNKMTKNV